MRIGVDGCCWSNRRGFGRFTRELVTHMVLAHPQHHFTLIADEATARQGQFPSGTRVVAVPTDAQATEAASAESSRSPRDLWRMARATAQCDFDVFFFPAVYSYYPMLRRIPTVVTFHDAIAEQHPGLIFPSRRSRWFWNAKTWLARRQADRVLTVSQSAKQQIVESLGYPEERITVISEGPGEGFGVMEDRSTVPGVLERYELPHDKPLLLYVGGISPHKNLQGLLKALERMRQASADAGNSPWHMVIVGDYKSDSFFGCYQELEELRSKLDLRQDVTFTGFVPNADLIALYNAATLLVLPSFSEGFGLPVVEAMACGLPVAASRVGSLPEVLGEAGLYFDPHDPAEMALAMRQILTNGSLRQRLKAEGLRRSQQFSWRRAAQDTVRLFEEMSTHALQSA